MRNFAKEHKGFFGASCVALLVIVGLGCAAGYFAVEGLLQKKQLSAIIETKEQLIAERMDLRGEELSEAAMNCAAIKKEGQELLTRVELFENKLKQGPVSLLDYTFELQETIEAIKASAESKKVVVGEQEHFGLELSATRKEALGLLNKKLLVLKEVMPKLIKCQPLEINSVGFDNNANDFSINISFTAHTQTFRRFLNETLSMAAPLALEVISVEKDGRGDMGPHFINSNPATFKLSLHYIDKEQLNHATPAENYKKGERVEWLAPRAQDKNIFMVYDLFTPPTLHRDERSGLLIAKAHPLITQNVNYMAARIVKQESIPYRVQLQGWSRTAKGDAIIAMLSCENSVAPIIAKSGDIFTMEGFTVVMCQEDNPRKLNTPHVEILDHLTGETVCLSENTTYLRNIEQVTCTENERSMIVGLYDKERDLFLQEETTYSVISHDEENALMYLRRDSQTKDFSNIPQVYLSKSTTAQ